MARSSPEARSEYLPATEALQRLGVRAQTLYAYVSRGWIRSIAQPGRKARLYLRADVDRMGARAQARAGHGPAAASAMNHGAPIIPTAITEITPAGPRYRGRLGCELADAGASFESVAELLWSGDFDERTPAWATRRAGPALQRLLASLPPPRSGERLLEQFALVTLGLGAEERELDTLRPLPPPAARTWAESRRIVLTLARCCGLIGPQQRVLAPRAGQRVADVLVDALGVPAGAANRQVIEAMLVLLADHELSPGTFSARVAASGGARLHSCVAAALCASSGAQVSQVFEQADRLLHGAASRRALLERANERLARGEAVPGFGHPLYPEGDPRARLLFALPRFAAPSRRLAAVRGLVDALARDSGLHPRHELPMAALLRDIGLPRAAASALFVVARVAGWAAHVHEQWCLGQLLRPRARFIAEPVLQSTINLDAGETPT